MLVAHSLALAALGVAVFVAALGLFWLGAAAIGGDFRSGAILTAVVAMIAIQVGLMIRSQGASSSVAKLSYLVASLFPLAVLLFAVTR